jgi:hypothetical protein
VTAQGIRDALHYGRLLGEAAAPVLDDARALDRVLRRWERRRERECLEIYAWTNALGVGEPMTPLEVELYRAAEADPALAGAMLDVFSRVKAPSEAFPLRRGARIAARAWRRAGGDDRVAVARAALRELRRATADRASRARARLAGPPVRSAQPAARRTT